jgi:hypothetical protein
MLLLAESYGTKPGWWWMPLPADQKCRELLALLRGWAAASLRLRHGREFGQGCRATVLDGHHDCMSTQRTHLIAGLEHLAWQVTLPVAADVGRGAGAARQRRHGHSALIPPCMQDAGIVT